MDKNNLLVLICRDNYAGDSAALDEVLEVPQAIERLSQERLLLTIDLGERLWRINFGDASCSPFQRRIGENSGIFPGDSRPPAESCKYLVGVYDKTDILQMQGMVDTVKYKEGLRHPSGEADGD